MNFLTTLLSKPRAGFSLLEIFFGLGLMGFLHYGAAVVFVNINQTSTLFSKRVQRIEAVAYFMSQVSCVETKKRATCGNRINLYDSRGKVVVEANGTSKLGSWNYAATCVGDKVFMLNKHIKEQKFKPLNKTLPVCKL